MVNENDRFKKAPGVKSSVNNIINGEFVKISDEFKPSYVIGLTGKDGGVMADLCDIEIRAPYSKYADRAQEIHIKVIHSLIHTIEQKV